MQLRSHPQKRTITALIAEQYPSAPAPPDRDDAAAAISPLRTGSRRGRASPLRSLSLIIMRHASAGRVCFATLLLLLLAAAPLCAGKPVRRKLNFNMFVLRPTGGGEAGSADGYEPAPVKVLLSTNGVSRFGPLLEYLVQRVQGLMSVRVHPDESQLAPESEPAVAAATRLPGVVVRPSRDRPGTYELEIAVTVDDGEPDLESHRRQLELQQ